MKETTKINVQILNYEDEKQLSRMLKGVLLQKGDFSITVNILDNNKISNLKHYAETTLGDQVAWKIYDQGSDYFGVKQIDGDYVAFCFEGDFWNDSRKLQDQIQILEENEHYVACVHDISIVNEKEVPYRFSRQQYYKKQRYSSYKSYTWKQLEKSVLPGSPSTLVCRNIFQTPHILSLLDNDIVEPDLRLFASILFEGDCYNLYRAQMTSQYYESVKQLNNASKLPVPNYNTVQNRLQALEIIKEYASTHYNQIFDDSYRLISLASAHFEDYKSGKKTSSDLNNFMELFSHAYRDSYALPLSENHNISEQKLFFDYLQNKIFRYQRQSGSTDEIILLKYMNFLNDNIRIEYILRCITRPRKPNLALCRKWIVEAENVSYVKQTVRKRVLTAPFRKCRKKVEAAAKKIHLLFKKMITYRLRKKGFSPYMANEWYDSVRINLLTDKTTPLQKKVWCYKRGFMPWRLFQYGLTPENYHQFLSDRDYMYLHQINNSYKKWIEDKMTFRYVLEPFKEYLPKYYFQIIRREGYPVLLPLMDCPEGYEATLDDLFRLLRCKGALALKAASGTHGTGFYKMAFVNGSYYMNNEESSEYEIERIIRNFRCYYIVTEYVDMHEQIKELYAGSVNTLRVMMINRSGYHPQLLDAYMRIGSSTTGTTDNVAYGGVFCKIDIATGVYGHAEQSKEHVLVSCPNHPDTHTPIKGVIPHWDLIKDKLILISKYIGQLEYLGFDVVCTPDSFIILEINSHQDLHRYLYYDEKIKQFYFDKLEYKHNLYK